MLGIADFLNSFWLNCAVSKWEGSTNRSFANFPAIVTSHMISSAFVFYTFSLFASLNAWQRSQETKIVPTFRDQLDNLVCGDIKVNVSYGKSKKEIWVGIGCVIYSTGLQDPKCEIAFLAIMQSVLDNIKPGIDVMKPEIHDVAAVLHYLFPTHGYTWQNMYSRTSREQIKNLIHYRHSYDFEWVGYVDGLVKSQNSKFLMLLLLYLALHCQVAWSYYFTKDAYSYFDTLVAYPDALIENSIFLSCAQFPLLECVVVNCLVKRILLFIKKAYIELSEAFSLLLNL